MGRYTKTIGGDIMSKTSTAVKTRYNEKAYDRVYLSVPKGMKEELQAAADKEGKSLRSYIIEALNEKLKGAE